MISLLIREPAQCVASVMRGHLPHAGAIYFSDAYFS